MARAFGAGRSGCLLGVAAWTGRDERRWLPGTALILVILPTDKGLEATAIAEANAGTRRLVER